MVGEVTPRAQRSIIRSVAAPSSLASAAGQYAVNQYVADSPGIPAALMCVSTSDPAAPIGVPSPLGAQDRPSPGATASTRAHLRAPSSATFVRNTLAPGKFEIRFASSFAIASAFAFGTGKLR